MSIATIQRLQSEVQQHPTSTGYTQLLAEEMRFLDEQLLTMKTAQRTTATMQQRSAALQEEIDALKQASQLDQRVLTKEECAKYHASWCALLKELSERRDTLQYLLTCSPEDRKYSDLTVASQWLDTWTTFLDSSDAAARELKYMRRGAFNGSSLPSTDALYDTLDVVCRLQLQARTLVGRERYRRSRLGEDAVDDFMDSQEQLREWCSKQRDTLNSLSSLDDLIEFSDSFYANVPVMDSNFIVLMEQSEGLMDHAAVQDGLREVNAEWVRLSLDTYSKVHEAVMKAHASSEIEKNCSEWGQEVAPSLYGLLQSAHAYLKKCSGAKTTPEVTALLATCEALLQEHEAHEVVCTHLTDFSVREDCVRPLRDALKKELQSSLTTTALTFPHYDDSCERVEYRNRIEELQEWIDAQSQKETYLKLLERLDLTKAIIEEHTDILFPDDVEG